MRGISLTLSIPFIFQAAALLASFTSLSHRVIYAPGDAFTCHRAAARNLLSICIIFKRSNYLLLLIIMY
ncbi:hypothetical protein BDD30_1807 [Photorhabdus asymbiotica]|uniref:Secreted protein n=1 Tax=Photorhabdus asymbiotica TaxID=291112 RepID=A0ABX9SNX3_9GAMM|nr:hypothetical protein BDD30_1807 [Photorhabdus asymbiotica]